MDNEKLIKQYFFFNKELDELYDYVCFLGDTLLDRSVAYELLDRLNRLKTSLSEIID